MKSVIKPLLIILVLQILIWGFFVFSDSSETRASASLVQADLTAATELKLEIEDADGNAVSLSRDESRWLLASGLPADAAKADALLEKLSGLNLRWPVSTKAASHQRFEVAADKFQRKLTLKGEGSEGVDETLYFGTSPGYQQVHARGGDDAVYDVKLANYELPATDDDWLDKSLLQAAGDVERVEWADTSVRLDNGQWMLSGDAGYELANIGATEAAVTKVTQLQVLGVLDSAPSAAPADARSILLQDADGEYRLSFWPRESNNDHVVMSTRYPGEAFRMANYVAEQLVPERADLEAPKVPDVDPQDIGGLLSSEDLPNPETLTESTGN